MYKYFFLILALSIASCKVKETIKIEYKLKDYDFNNEIAYYLGQTKDGGQAATNYSFVSEHENLIKARSIQSDSVNVISPEIAALIQENYKPVNAIDHIVLKAKDHDILMFNEAHFIPQHRNFIAQLLPRLSELGFKYLALEGLGMMDTGEIYDKEINNRTFPIYYSGFYIKEPEFGNLVRLAQDLDIELIGYDGGRGGDREINGAKNILKQIEKDGVLGKTIVLCGWDHIKEVETGTYWGFALAGRIKEFSGSDPLTINQTQYYERSERVFEDSLYQTTDYEEPTLLINQNGESIDLEENKDWYDLFVFHPRTKFTYGIPNWILANKTIKEFEWPEIDINCPCKILMFEESDDIDLAVPTYIREVQDLKQPVSFPVSNGQQYKFVVASDSLSYLVDD